MIHPRRSSDLEFVATEELILVAFRAVCTLEAANEQNRHSKRDQDGQHTRVGPDQLSKSMHMPRRTAPTNSVL